MTSAAAWPFDPNMFAKPGRRDAADYAAAAERSTALVDGQPLFELDALDFASRVLAEHAGGRGASRRLN
ncbi:MAG: hypothetical protein JO247_22390 [Chloroflexi bacterium]|nr:hypothetical protein [Chloroflexota bacterium]